MQHLLKRCRRQEAKKVQCMGLAGPHATQHSLPDMHTPHSTVCSYSHAASSHRCCTGWPAHKQCSPSRCCPCGYRQPSECVLLPPAAGWHRLRRCCTGGLLTSSARLAAGWHLPAAQSRAATETVTARPVGSAVPSKGLELGPWLLAAAVARHHLENFRLAVRHELHVGALQKWGIDV